MLEISIILRLLKLTFVFEFRSFARNDNDEDSKNVCRTGGKLSRFMMCTVLV